MQASVNSSAYWEIVYITKSPSLQLPRIFSAPCCCETLSSYFHNQQFNKSKFNKFNDQDVTISKKWINGCKITEYSNIWWWATIEGHDLFQYSWIVIRIGS